MEWRFVTYGSDRRDEWNSFVRNSRNGSFIHLRGYMDYHSDRFCDASLMAYKGERLMALIPAEREGDCLRSHGGLTYGGWILPRCHLDAPDFMEMWKGWLDWCNEADFASIEYRPVPHIYPEAPSQEDLYALWLSGAVMTECNLSAAIDLESNPGLNAMRRRHLRKCAGIDFSISIDENVEDFHRMLSDCLAERHAASPVHSRGELQLLRDRFPDNIEIHVLRVDGRPAAGVCLFVTPRTMHCQYIATSREGRALNLLTPLFDTLVHYAKTRGCRYFDFGTSNEDHGRVLNTGLIRQKYSYGATGVAYQRFTIKLL